MFGLVHRHVAEERGGFRRVVEFQLVDELLVTLAGFVLDQDREVEGVFQRQRAELDWLRHGFLGVDITFRAAICGLGRQPVDRGDSIPVQLREPVAGSRDKRR
jgi:hypothetical protein